MDQFSVPPYAPAVSSSPVEFAGDRGVFRRLVTRGALLELITVGFYRFWLATDMRRHLWSSTIVDGDGLEYTGRAKELLIGFFVAMAILTPFYLFYSLGTVEATRLHAFAGFALFLVTYLFGQFAIYRARRYRLTRTTWRGVRFWMSGSGWNYALRAGLWGILTVLSFGFALPWHDAALERYKMRHTYYGDLQASFEGRGWDFFKRGWWLWLLTLVAIGSMFALPGVVAAKLSAGFILSVSLVLFGGLIVSPFIYGAFKAVQWRWWLEGIQFGGVNLKSELSKARLIGLYWKVIGWGLLVGLLLGIYASIVIVAISYISGQATAEMFKGSNIMHLPTLSYFALLALGYVAYILTMNVIMRVYLIRDVWQRVVDSVTVHGIEATADVTAKGELANALGEGFADGFDVAGF